MGYSPMGSQLDATELLSMHTYLMRSPWQRWTYLRHLEKLKQREVNHFKSCDNVMANLRSWHFKPRLLRSHSGSPESCTLPADWQTEASRTQQTHKRGGGTCGHSGGRNWESKLGIYTLPWGKQRAVGTCCVTQGGFVMTSGVGWGRWKREGMHVKKYLIHFIVIQHCKASILQLKKKYIQKKKKTRTHTQQRDLYIEERAEEKYCVKWAKRKVDNSQDTLHLFTLSLWLSCWLISRLTCLVSSLLKCAISKQAKNRNKWMKPGPHNQEKPSCLLRK